jgi:hypothetical protein
MKYALIENAAVTRYPFNAADLKLLRKDVSFPADISDETMRFFGAVEIQPITPPAYDAAIEICEEVAPAFDSGTQVWRQSWAVRAKTAEELAVEAQIARDKRNQLLAASDWTQLADAPIAAAAWGVYRQALRDITSQPGFPGNIDWPLAP